MNYCAKYSKGSVNWIKFTAWKPLSLQTDDNDDRSMTQYDHKLEAQH